MTRYIDNEKIPINSRERKPAIFDFTKIDFLWLFSEIIIKVSKYFPIIIFSMGSVNILLAVNDLFTNNIGFAILNSIFALGDFIFLIQLYQRHKAHQYENQSVYNNNDSVVVESIRN